MDKITSFDGLPAPQLVLSLLLLQDVEHAVAQIMQHLGQALMALLAGSRQVYLQQVQIQGLVDQQIQAEQLETILAAKGDLSAEDHCQFREHLLDLGLKLRPVIHAFLLRYQAEDSLRQDDGARRVFLLVLQLVLRVIGEMLLLVVEVDGLQRVGLVAQSAVEPAVVVHLGL